MKNVIICIIISFILIPFTISRCSDDEVTKVIIEMEFDTEKFAFHKPTLMDRILGFFLKTAHAANNQTILDNVILVTVDIYIPGGGIIRKNFDLNKPEVMLNVPSGPGRVFDLKAYIHPQNKSSSLMFRGVKIENLQPGVLKTIHIVMRNFDTKLVIPDYGFGGTGKLHHMNYINGDAYTAFTGTDFGITDAQFRPNDVDFDAWGNIFIANSPGVGQIGFNRIYKVDNLIDKTIASSPNHDPGILSVVVDRIRNIVYYSDGTNLYKDTIDFTGETTLTINPPITLIRGMDVNEFGALFIVGQAGTDSIFKYNPDTQSVIGQINVAQLPFLAQPNDIIVKNGLVHVINTTGGDNYRILSFRYDLSFVNAFGLTTHGDATWPSVFFGPQKFLDGYDNRLFVIDENASYNRIISIDYLGKFEWKLYPNNGGNDNTTGPFRFNN